MGNRVLILCTGNSARSQMAEGLFRAKAAGTMEVYSAGTMPKELNPLAVEAMKEIGIDISHHRSKDVSTFGSQAFDYVITVCDRARESCPVFPGANKIHWGMPDPQDLESFRDVRNRLSSLIDHFLREHSGSNSGLDESLRGEIRAITERNRRVESEKAWETSWTRRLIIMSITYIVGVIFFSTAGLPHPYLNALVPMLGFFLSTLTLPLFKVLWLKYRASK